MEAGVRIRVEARDARGRLKFSWPTRLVAHGRGELALSGDWERPLQLPDGREAPIPNRSLEFYYAGKPYAVAALFDRAWKLQEYYVRMVRPPRWEDPPRETLTLELLGLDIQVKPDYEYELIEHSPDGKSDLGPEDEGRLRAGVFEVLEQVERREGVFDPQRLREWVERARRV